MPRMLKITLANMKYSIFSSIIILALGLSVQAAPQWLTNVAEVPGASAWPSAPASAGQSEWSSNPAPAQSSGQAAWPSSNPAPAADWPQQSAPAAGSQPAGSGGHEKGLPRDLDEWITEVNRKQGGWLDKEAGWPSSGAAAANPGQTQSVQAEWPSSGAVAANPAQTQSAQVGWPSSGAVAANPAQTQSAQAGWPSPSAASSQAVAAPSSDPSQAVWGNVQTNAVRSQDGW